MSFAETLSPPLARVKASAFKLCAGNKFVLKRAGKTHLLLIWRKTNVQAYKRGAVLRSAADRFRCFRRCRFLITGTDSCDPSTEWPDPVVAHPHRERNSDRICLRE